MPGLRMSMHTGARLHIRYRVPELALHSRFIHGRRQVVTLLDHIALPVHRTVLRRQEQELRLHAGLVGPRAFAFGSIGRLGGTAARKRKPVVAAVLEVALIAQAFVPAPHTSPCCQVHKPARPARIPASLSVGAAACRDERIFSPATVLDNHGIKGQLAVDLMRAHARAPRDTHAHEPGKWGRAASTPFTRNWELKTHPEIVYHLYSRVWEVWKATPCMFSSSTRVLPPARPPSSNHFFRINCCCLCTAAHR